MRYIDDKMKVRIREMTSLNEYKKTGVGIVTKVAKTGLVAMVMAITVGNGILGNDILSSAEGLLATTTDVAETIETSTVTDASMVTDVSIVAEVNEDNETAEENVTEAEIETRAMYRMYNPNSGEHFYTASSKERDNLFLAGWSYEGVAWYAPTTGNPVYRLYNENAGDHHYSVSENERDNLVALGWKFEGIAWYSGGETPLYRLYNPNAVAGSHHYTTSYKEVENLVSLGWKYEEIAWYGYMTSKNADIPELPIGTKTPIMGENTATKDQMVKYYNSKATYPEFYADSDAPTIEDFCQIYIEEAAAEGVDVSVAFCQAMMETGFLRYGGLVDISQFNFAGIGATDSVGNRQIAEFASVREGARAQIQHLKAYACSEALNNPCVDPRFDLVQRNSAPYIEWLGINENPYKKGWASAKRYGYNILNLYIAKMLEF